MKKTTKKLARQREQKPEWVYIRVEGDDENLLKSRRPPGKKRARIVAIKVGGVGTYIRVDGNEEPSAR